MTSPRGLANPLPCFARHQVLARFLLIFPNLQTAECEGSGARTEDSSRRDLVKVAQHPPWRTGFAFLKSDPSPWDDRSSLWDGMRFLSNPGTSYRATFAAWAITCERAISFNWGARQSPNRYRDYFIGCRTRIFRHCWLDWCSDQFYGYAINSSPLTENSPKTLKRTKRSSS
jgi:hypothetical protein